MNRSYSGTSRWRLRATCARWCSSRASGAGCSASLELTAFSQADLLGVPYTPVRTMPEVTKLVDPQQTNPGRFEQVASSGNLRALVLLARVGGGSEWELTPEQQVLPVFSFFTRFSRRCLGSRRNHRGRLDHGGGSEWELTPEQQILPVSKFFFKV